MAYSYKIPNLSTPFNNYIDTEIPNVTANVYIVKDYSQNGTAYTTCPIIRAMTTVINWKSNVNNADMTHNFRTKLGIDLCRGDIVIDKDTGSIGLVSWNVDTMIDCLRTQVTQCDAHVAFYRNTTETLDPNTGERISAGGEQIIVNNMPIIYAEMYGRYDYDVKNNTPGIIPNQDVEVKIQYNNATKYILEGDTFTVHGIKHHIVIVNRSQIDIDDAHGIIVLTCKRDEQ